MKATLCSCSLLLAAVTSRLFQNGAAAEAFSVSTSSYRQAALGSTQVRRVATELTLTRNENLRIDKARTGLSRSHDKILFRLRAGGTDGDKVARKDLLREMLAEMLGTFLIVALGTGSVMSAVYDNALVGLFQIAAVWAFAVTVAISTTASVSGAHLNPAISFALALFRPSKSFGWSKMLPYCLAQLAGGVLGSLVNFLMFAAKIKDFEKVNSIVRGTSASIASAKAFGEYYVAPVTWPLALLAETVGTAILSFVIFSLTNPKNDTDKNIPALIGITVGALICVIAPLTQAGFNPARDFGPRIVAWMAGWGKIAFQGWWVYVVGPLIGAPIGAYVADKLLLPNDE